MNELRPMNEEEVLLVGTMNLKDEKQMPLEQMESIRNQYNLIHLFIALVLNRNINRMAHKE